MLEIGVKSTLGKLVASLDALDEAQLPFTIAKALTATAIEAQTAVRLAMPSEFILRRDWIVKGIRIQPATKTDQRAILYSKDPFMGRQEYGGEKIPKLGGRYVAVPIEARPSDAMLIPKELLPGNMPRGTYVTSRRTGLPVASREGAKGAAFILHATDGRTYLARRMAGRLQMLYLLVGQADVKPRLNMGPIAQKIVHQRFAKNFMTSLRDAMATRREGAALTEKV